MIVVKLDDFIGAMAEKGQACDRAELRRVEHALGVTIPADYSAFLLATNGGSVDGVGFPVIEDGSDYGFGLVEVFRLREDPDSHVQSLEEVDNVLSDVLHPDVMAIMGDHGGNLVCIGHGPDIAGAIFHWDHEHANEPTPLHPSDPASGHTKVASSFSEFVAGLEATDDSEFEG